MIYRPIYVENILPYTDTPFVKILTGVRRCGKSTILKMLIEELVKRGVDRSRILHYNFDSLQYEDIKTARKLYEEIKIHLAPTGKTYLFLDEVQEVKSWEKAVNSFMTDFDVDVYVTGSNSRMMSSEISTYLTGRYVSFRIFPLSFREYLSFRKEYSAIGELYAEFVRYLKLGGFPVVHLREYTQDEVYTVVKDIYNSTIFTDIVKRNQIRKVDQLERIVKFAFDNVGRTFSATSISKYLKSENRTIDNETVYNYLCKLESAYILHRCSRFDVEGKEILKTQEKFYLADSAFRYSILGYSSDSVATMLENLVYLELLRRGYDVYVGKLGRAEVDFVAIKQENKIYIQVCQMIGSEETAKREYGRLLDIHDNYPKFVLRTDKFAGGNYEGIQTMHIADFLLYNGY
ncbi:MAG: ATP-binding protein [Clostridia bacterium]|nr:ATP-binding protein [Clostridia bacterium]